MPPSIEPLSAQLAHGEGSLLAGDLGLVVVKALLENGVGWLVTGWLAGSNPIDAAIADTQHGVLARAGVSLRRMRTFAQVERAVTAPAGGVGALDGMTHRGAVVWHGRAGMRPALERFAGLSVPRSVVGFCFDAEITRSTDAIVFDPEPTPAGIVRAIDQAFATSHAMGRPALVLLRERALSLRGTMRCRENVAPRDASALDEHLATGLTPAEAVAAARANVVAPTGGTAAVVCGLPLATAVQRALRMVVTTCAGSDPDVAAHIEQVAVLALAVPTVTVPQELEEIVGPAERVLVLEDGASDIARRVAAVRAPERVCLPYDRVRGDDVLRAIVEWVCGASGLVDAATPIGQDVLALAAPVLGEIEERTAGRVPRRNATLHRELPPVAAAGLILAQGVIGVPTRLDTRWPSYHTERGVPLTVVASTQFAAHGVAVAAPAAQVGGVFLLVGPIDGSVQQAAMAAGATVEAVDGTRPRAVGRAIARACASPRLHPHVIVLAPALRVVASDRDAGFDPELLGSDPLAWSALPDGTVGLEERPTDELAAGPVGVVRNPDAARTSVAAAAELAPAWYDVRVRRSVSSSDRVRWQATRRFVRSMFKVEM